ncbi:MAG: hypothetical protein V1755_05605 [Chloroflexota bacterium]
MLLASIKGEDGKRIQLRIGKGCKGRMLLTSNGDDVHPSPEGYPAGVSGRDQAMDDIAAMWGRDPDWDLQWIGAGASAVRGA